MKRKNKKRLICLALCLLCALGSALVGMALAKNAPEVYGALQKPPLSPPAWVFGAVWSVLYLLMGVSAFLILDAPQSEGKKSTLLLYVCQLALNLLWVWVFFRLRLFAAAFLFDVFLAALIAGMIVRSEKHSAWAAALQLPYLFWTCFAGYLNLFIVLLN